MRRKAGSLVPLELAICTAAADLRRQGTDEFHGYLIAKQIKEHADTRLLTAYGTLYRALARLLESGLIAELDERPDPAHDDERRRYYQLTERGIAVARAEAQRLESQLSAARSRRLLGVRA